MRFSERIASRLRLPLLAACLLASVASRAADPAPAPAPIPSMKLNDGRVLHNVRVKSNEPNSLVVLADEGFLKIAKSNLPKEVADAYPAKADAAAGPDMVMQPFNPNPSDGGPGQPAPPRSKPKPSPTPRASSTVNRGCTIVSFQAKAFQNALGCADIVIRNDTDAVAAISPGEIVCVTTTGLRYAGRNFVTDGDTPSVKRQEIVPARGDVTDIITFTNDALDISYVQWAR